MVQSLVSSRVNLLPRICCSANSTACPITKRYCGITPYFTCLFLRVISCSSKGSRSGPKKATAHLIISTIAAACISNLRFVLMSSLGLKPNNYCACGSSSKSLVKIKWPATYLPGTLEYIQCQQPWSASSGRKKKGNQLRWRQEEQVTIKVMQGWCVW